MSWLDDFVLQDIHECARAWVCGDHHDKDGDPKVWLVYVICKRAGVVTDTMNVFACRDWCNARELADHINHLATVYRRLTA